ncbi:MAG: hypothetical protein HY082_04730 [Gammaproteobacteria bacterium]|nr:hypothetical protein [Gammaproteobacteria bacterium]
MLKLSTRHQIAIGIALAALMIATRGQHFPTVKQMLPSASWAVFFLAGVYLRPAWALAALFGLASFLDFAAINWQGVSDYCVSPAYIALIPAYAVLWFGGRWFAGRYSVKPVALLWLAASVLVSVFVCELISSGSFYFFSGRFAEPTLVEFANRIVKYFPTFLGSTAFWIATAALVHTAVVVTRDIAVKPKQA